MLFVFVWFLAALFQVSVLSWGWGSVKSKLKLISAKAEARASSFGLAELGNIDME